MDSAAQRMLEGVHEAVRCILHLLNYGRDTLTL